MFLTILVHIFFEFINHLIFAVLLLILSSALQLLLLVSVFAQLLEFLKFYFLLFILGRIVGSFLFCLILHCRCFLLLILIYFRPEPADLIIFFLLINFFRFIFTVAIHLSECRFFSLIETHRLVIKPRTTVQLLLWSLSVFKPKLTVLLALIYGISPSVSRIILNFVFLSLTLPAA